MFPSRDSVHRMVRVQADEVDASNTFGIGDHLGQNWNTADGFWSQGTLPDPETVNNYSNNHGEDQLSGGGSAAPPTTSSANDMAGSPDIALSYINHILMEEDLGDQAYMLPEDPALIAAEKTFYDVLDEYKNSADQSLPHADSTESTYFSLNNGASTNGVMGNSLVSDFAESHYSHVQSISVDYASPSSLDSFASVSNSVVDGPDRYLIAGPSMPDLYFGSQPVEQFNKALQDSRKFLPGSGPVVSDLQTGSSLLPQNRKSEGEPAVVRGGGEEPSSGDSRGRKNSRSDDLDFEGGRSAKMSAVSSGEGLSKMFEEMLHLCIDVNGCADGEAAARSQKQVKGNAKNGSSKRSGGGGKSQGKKQVKMEVIDLGTLLLQCAQSVSTVDYRAVNEQLQMIRQHSSIDGDGSQRLAHYFAVGLEARIAGIGSQIYQSRLAKRSTTAADILKAYHLYMGISPFKRISHFFANQSILNVAGKAATIHIIDFGIGFGFQWPCLFRRLSKMKGVCPKVRITGIDLPQPGFRPRERLEETGCRLADCAQSFNVPFEYSAIASKWENIQVKDLNIVEGEVVIVNCLYMLRILADETVIVESPRNTVLNNIRKVNPDLFVVGVMSSAYGSPFFITRFREALFYYSALFDVLENNVVREDPYRLLIEREIFGREAMNIIACEGSDRVYRPETYKQWRGRNQQAGFKQLCLNPDILKIAKHSVLSCYDRNFIVEEDNEWMLLGWKGRVLYALSTWKPARSGT